MAKGNGTPKLRIGIIGAGIAGSCLTIGLLHHPLLDVHLYEAHPSIAKRGSGVTFHGNALNAMDLISPEIKRVYGRRSHFIDGDADRDMATQVVIASGRNAGTVVAELGKAKGRRSVHRADFVNGLLDEVIPAERVHFGKRLASITQESENEGPVTATFADGTSEIFDLLFGAEGVHSITRKFILGEHHPAAHPVNHDTWRIFRRAIPMEEASEVLTRGLIDTIRIRCTPLGPALAMPIEQGKTLSISCVPRDCKRGSKAGAPFDAEEWKDFSPEVYALALAVGKDPQEGWKTLDHDHADIYYRGRVAMIGDAAHATLPHSGNGAAQAIEDVAILTGIFRHISSGDEIAAALGAFDRIRRPRSQKVVDLTRLMGRLQSLDEEDVESMERQMREAAMFTNFVDMPAQVQDAVDFFLKEKEVS
ncbi:hypothetical protein F4778DRAFT_552833 [Xylariomycetidae sp. FL2044]|nr:hypothetical protein F4778DRAFT_552833 [Xylariomycetidae sp. FL2044]